MQGGARLPKLMHDLKHRWSCGRSTQVSFPGKKKGYQRIIQYLQKILFIYLLILSIISVFEKSVIIIAHIYDLKMQ